MSVSLNGETTTSSEPSAKKEPKKDSSLPSFLQGSACSADRPRNVCEDESDEDMEDAEGLAWRRRPGRQASESWKPVDRGGAVHLGC